MRFRWVTYQHGPRQLALVEGVTVRVLDDGEELDFLHPPWGRAVVQSFGAHIELHFSTGQVFSGEAAIAGVWQADLADAPPPDEVSPCGACDGTGQDPTRTMREERRHCLLCRGTGLVTPQDRADHRRRFHELVGATGT